MEFLYEYGLFLLKLVTFVVAIAFVVGIVAEAGQRQKSAEKGHIEVNKINEQLDNMHFALKRFTDGESAVKKEIKEKEKKQKLAHKQAKKTKAGDDNDEKKRVFLVDFDGDIKASAVSELRRVVNAILSTAQRSDEVVVRLESSGGMVHSYGLASSQLDRLRQNNIPLTVCVDKVAASGGYMMACVANKILAAPFAIIGSIGVVAQLPNFHKLLKKNDIDFEQLTAGEYKRTLTLFGENTEKARNKFVEDLELTHQLFKEFVKQQRPVVEIDEVSTGEIWFGTKALEKQLVDQLRTSDDYVCELAAEHEVFHVSYRLKKTLPEKFGLSLQHTIDRTLTRLLDQLRTTRFFQ
ncbi:MAG: serine protease SohB [Cellvibrionaceae bacterium]